MRMVHQTGVQMGAQIYEPGAAGFSLHVHLPGFHFGPIPIFEPRPSKVNWAVLTSPAKSLSSSGFNGSLPQNHTKKIKVEPDNHAKTLKTEAELDGWEPPKHRLGWTSRRSHSPSRAWSTP